jgi:hypothetical protein
VKVLIDIGHPAHVHFFKNFILNSEAKGHQVLITAMDKDVSLSLLKSYDLKYSVVGKKRNSKFGLIFEWIKRDYEILGLARNFNPDILMGISNPCIAHVSRILKKSSIIFDDTEHASFAHKITYPFADVICTPSSFKIDVGNKHVRYAGCHELAYLHPNYFTPDENVLKEIGLNTAENLFLIRFAAFVASHDTHAGGFRKEYVLPLIEKLNQNGKVVIVSEKELDPDLKQYQYSLSPDKYLDVLYYSKMYIGEGSTSAEEAGILGVPSLHFERLDIQGAISCLTPFIGIIDELENDYGLMHSFCDEEELLHKVDEILLDVNKYKKEWEMKRERFLNDKIDVTAFLVWLLENYPLSIKKLKGDPKLQFGFG